MRTRRHTCSQRAWDYDADGTEEPLEPDDLALCEMLLDGVPTGIDPLNDGLRTLQFQSLSINPESPTAQVFGGTQDNGTWSFDSSRSQADRWFETVGGDVALRSFSVLKPGGRAAFIASGPQAPTSPRPDVQSLRPNVARDRRHLERIVELVALGVVKLPEIATFPLSARSRVCAAGVLAVRSCAAICASTAVSIMLGLLKTCFPDRIDAWEPRLRELIPSYGETLNARPEVARESLGETAGALALTA